MNSSAGISKHFSNSLRRVLVILALSLGLVGFSLPGFSQSPAPNEKDPTLSAKKAASRHSGRTAPQGSSQPPAPMVRFQNATKLVTSFSGTSSTSTNGIASRNADDSAQGNAISMLLSAGHAQPLAMLKGDFDRDGYEDLVAGYGTSIGAAIVFYRGNQDAFAPQSDASFQAMGRGDFPAPFLPQATVIAVPVNPDFMATGDFAGNGFQDIVIAANGGRSLYILPGDGKGNFGAPQELDIAGTVTTLASGEFGGGKSRLFVGVSDPASGAVVSIFGETGGALAVIQSYPVPGAVSDIQFGDFGDTGMDAAFLSGGQIQILRSSTMQIETVSLPADSVAMALGSFLFDRNGGTQIALLGIDGSVQIAARSEFDPRAFSVQEFNSIRQARLRRQNPALLPARSFPKNGWKIVESFPSMGSVNTGAKPLFFRTRVSNNGGDDVMWVNASSGQMAVISHPDSQPGSSTFAPGQVSALPYSGTPVNALPMRVGVSGLSGILALHADTVSPFVVPQGPPVVFFVNRTDDPLPASPIANACNNVSSVDVTSSCSIREALLRNNGNTIMVPAGTITLSRAKVTNDFTGQNGALYVNTNVTIVGAGQATTIIQAGTLGQSTGTPNGVDMVMAVNEDIGTITNATATISNLTLQNGHNRGTLGNDGDGGCMEYDTGSSGNANLFLTNVTLNNCDTTQGDGAGLVIFNFTAPANGLATISNSIFQNNSAVELPANGAASGGGIWVSNPAGMVMTSSQVNNNIATEVSGGSKGTAGGLLIDSSQTGHQTLIHSSKIFGNTAAGSGGGIWAAANIVIDTGTVISGNTAGNDGSSSNVGGGGIYYNSSGTDVLALSKVTITGNTAAGNGGAIAIGNDSGGPTMTMSFSRLAGNTSAFNAATSNVWNDDSTLTATNNWWGTNAPAGTIVNTHNGAGPAPVTTFDPFIVLTNTANPASVPVNGATTLTASFLQDNHGAAIAVGNLDVLTGVAPSTPLTITFGNAVLGTITAVNGTGSNTTGTIQPNGKATATFTAGNAGGTGHADATVDNATVTANIIIPGPPVIIKAFGAASIPLGGSTSLTFTIQNNNATQSLSGIAFSDTLPAGLVISTPNGLVGVCGGTVTATSGSSAISLTGGALAVSSSCTIAVNVVSIAAGTQNNTTGNVTSTEGGTGGTASATINVVAPPTFSKAFGAANIPLNGTTSLTFTITNPAANAVAETGVAFTDTLPSGLIVATPNGLTNTCGGTVTSVAASGSVSLTGGTIAVGSNCTLTVNVKATSSGQLNNTTGTISSTNGGTGLAASASISVATPPTITKSFGAASIPLNGSTSLSFTVTNPNASTALTGLAFTDTLPSGVVIATPSGLNSTCTGTSTAVTGSGQVSLAAGTLAATASCTITVNITGTTAGVKNNSVQITSTEAGTGNTSNASVTVVAPPVIIKAFGAASIPNNGSTSLTFTIQNNNTTTTLTGTGFSDTLPAGLVISTPNGLTGTCGGGTITATAGTNVINLSGAGLAASTSCTFAVNTTGTAAGTKNNTTGNVTSTEGGAGGTASASVNVVSPPTIAKAFGATSIPLNGTTSLTFTISNPAANAVTETGVAFTDTFPAGIVVATPNGLTNTCGGTATAVAGSGSVSLTNGTVAVTSNCTLTINVTGTASGQFTNTTGAVSSTNGGPGLTATANLTVASPPTITKAFGAASIPLNGSTSLTFNIANPNTTTGLSGIAFTDTIPTGLVVATPSGLNSTCTGTATAVAGSGQVSLAAGTLAASANCTVSVNVTGTTPGVKNNSVQVTSTEGGTGNTSNASVTVVGAPVIIKAFGAASVPLNGATSLTFTIQNNNTGTALTGTGVTDTLPAGLVVSTPNGLTGSCGGGTITATAGTNVVSLSGATLAATTSCTFSVNTTGTTTGTKNNTTGNVTSTEGGTGGTASASVNVVSPPSIAKAFGATNISLNGSTSLTFTITNPAGNAVAETGVAFTDALPAGIVVATPNALTNTCGGTATATAGSGNISLTAGTVAATSSCTLTVNVTGTASGAFTNTTGVVTSTNGGTGNTATANLTVASPPTITKVFGAASIPLNGSTSLTFNITNPNTAVTLNGIAFTDTFPAGLVVTTPTNITSTCGGSAIAASGSGQASLTAGALAPSASCTISVTISGTTGGIKNNSVQVTSTEGGAGNISNASVTVVSAPVIIKAFGAASVPLNGSTSLTFTLQNNNASTALTGAGFTDTLPAGLAISTPNGLTGTCGAGTITATAGTGVVSLSGGSIAASASCTFAVNVTGTSAGTKNNTTGNVTSTEGGTGGTASASINVVSAPVIAKAFGAANIPLNGTTSLTFTITNPAANAVAEAGVAFTDALPAGIVVAVPNGLTNSCAGTATATAGSGSVALTGGTIAASSNCTLTVNVTGVASGQFVNTTGAVSSTNGGTGNTATANISVATPPVIVKAFGAASIPLNGSTSLTFTLSNPSANTIPLTGVGFADNLPAGLVVATPSALTTTCGGIATAIAGSSTVTLAGNTLAPNGSCTFSANISGTTGGVKNNSVTATAVESGAGNTSNASITVVTPATIVKTFGAASVPLNGSTSLTFTIQNNNATLANSGIAFTDTLPAGLVISTPNGLTGSCGGGTITAVQATGTVSLTGGTLAPSASCTFSINSTGTTAGAKNNTTGNITSVEGGTGGTASASLAVVAPPVIGKAFTPTTASVTTNSVLTLTITNPAANSVALTGVAFTDTFPAGLVVGTPNALTNTCGGVVTATSGAGITSLAGGTIAANSSCAISMNVTSAVHGPFNNTTGAVTSTNGGTGNTASASITVISPDLTITQTHIGNFIAGEIGATYVLTVSNTGSDATLGVVTVVDTLPTGLTATAISGTGWTCTLATLTCTRSDALAAGASYPVITITVNVATNAPNTVTNNATVSGGGEVNVANDTAAGVTIISTFSIAAAISGNTTITVRAGQTATFNLTVTPIGGAVTIPVTLAATGTAPLTTITVLPTPVTPGSNPVSFTVTAVTTAGLGLLSQETPPKSTPIVAILFPFGLLALTGLGATKYKTNKKFAGWIAIILMLSFFGMGVMGCVGSQNNFQNLGTSPGTYAITVTASVAGTQQTLNLTLIVTP